MCTSAGASIFQINDGCLWRRNELWVIYSSEGYSWCILRIPVKEGRIRRSHSVCPTCFSEMRQPRWRMHPSNETSGGRSLQNETICPSFDTERWSGPSYKRSRSWFRTADGKWNGIKCLYFVGHWRKCSSLFSSAHTARLQELSFFQRE